MLIKLNVKRVGKEMETHWNAMSQIVRNFNLLEVGLNKL